MKKSKINIYDIMISWYEIEKEVLKDMYLNNSDSKKILEDIMFKNTKRQCIFENMEEKDAYTILEECEKNGIEIISIFMDEYPKEFLRLERPPFLIYIKGEKENLKKNKILITGSKNITFNGSRMTKDIIEALPKKDIAIYTSSVFGVEFNAEFFAKTLKRDKVIFLKKGILSLKNMNEWKENTTYISNAYYIKGNDERLEYKKQMRIYTALSNSTIIVQTKKDESSIYLAYLAEELSIDVYTPSASIYEKEFDGNNYLIGFGCIPIISLEDMSYIRN